MQDRWITDWPVSERWPHYTRSDAGEVLPTPASPLGQQFCWDRGICLGWRDGYVRQGSYSLDELGLPCVVSATDATHRIVDRALVEVNGDTGPITVVEVPA